MSKTKELQIEARRQQISGMDKIMQNNPAKELREHWNSLFGNSDYLELAKDDSRFYKCCDEFQYLISIADWRA